MKKRILALMLTLAMVLSVLPGAVFAADTADNDILTYADLADIDKDIVIPDEASATAELSVADAVRATAAVDRYDGGAAGFLPR